jgi:WXG100 family type VII secretion target
VILSFDADRHAETLVHLRQAVATLQENLDALDREVTALRGQWSGTAQAAYDGAHRQWAELMDGLRAALHTATDAARAAGDRLTQTESDITALWG